ncbi:glycoside hydrolase family 32 protein [Arsenicicoccus sp. MKL-02]|uniref:beta-fructofuranosidase n=1 Tax=Arsenicicoccus cauae TaxID=2663847 RepID=A0A6I3ITP2_9MICO|nr:glycoside hydrolase family 32 protein [Arsenicicoccus cauae]MTB71671.1 glycoside hydrolase family 32 protein [Arsenicicoccus cauae]
MSQVPPVVPTHHVRPRRGWLNDPNGMTRHGDRWHVFYQHNPEAAVHDLIHWGHASSPDLVRWTEHPVAFGPTPDGPDRFGCWSGVFVPGLDRPAVAYSGVVDETFASTVCLRWALDDELDRWSEPVVVATTPSADRVSVMRDPFVFTHGGRRWALLGAGLDDSTPAVLLYSCDDILAWGYVGLWLTHADPVAAQHAPADIWECPQLVYTPGGTALVLSLQHETILDRAVWLVGDLATDGDGRPTFVARTGGPLDAGDVLYAPQVLQDEPEPLLLGWVRQDGIPADPADLEEQVADLVAGCLTFPRRLSVEGDELRSRLDPAVGTLMDPGADRPLAAGDAAVVELSGLVRVPGGPGTWRLTGLTAELGGPVGDGVDVWIDGEVVEVYPRDGSAPSTWHDVGTRTWTVETDVAARIHALTPEPR